MDYKLAFSKYPTNQISIDNLDIQNIVDKLLQLWISEYGDIHAEEVKQLRSKDNYKLLVLNVGDHDNGQISIECSNSMNHACEIAHIDSENIQSRLFILDCNITNELFRNDKTGYMEPITVTVDQKNDHFLKYECKS